MIVLGVNGFFNADHDAGAAIVADGAVLAAVEEERLVRRKRAVGLTPDNAVREVLEISGVDAGAVDVVAYGWNPRPLRLDPPVEADRILAGIRAAGCRLRPGAKVEFVDHHVAHAWSGLVYVPVHDRADVGVLALDGSGETTSGAGFTYRDGHLRRDWHLPLASSLGVFYEAATAAVGFGWGEEGKTMGLAAYGRPDQADRMPRPPDGRFTGRLPDEAPDYHAVLTNFAAAFRQTPTTTFIERADLAASAQHVLTSRIEELLFEQDPPPVVVLAGGTALNCAANGELAISLAARGSALVIPPPAGDAGLALGAAVAVAVTVGGDGPPTVHKDVYLGRAYTPDDTTRGLAAQGLTVRPCTLDELAVRLCEDEAVVGWFDGAAEIGPRALGSRCVIARPDSTRLRDRVNLLKGRESWRPLAPSVSAAEFARSFTGEPSRHMLKAATVAPDAHRRLAGVTHADGTARPQVLDTADGPYGRLIAAIGAITGTEALICTSFNTAGEPIVYTPQDALRSAIRMGLDALAGDGWIVELKGRGL
jgi:carbamoyltransferase